MANLRFDPDFFKIISAYPTDPPPPAKDVFDLRASTDVMIAAISSQIPVAPDVDETIIHFTTKDGTSLPLYRFTPPAAKQANTPQPAIVYIHGGGMVCGSVPIFKPSIIYYAAETGVTVYAVEYRLAPEFPFPTPVEDVYTAVEWLQSHAQEQGVDPARIGICGASAGGGIAAGVTLMARDQALTPPLAKQVLVYPMLDDRTDLPPENPLSPFLTWTMHNNRLGWGSYLGSDRTHVSPYAAPARATDVSRLPRTYIDVGGLDLFRDEDITYASRLAVAGVDVELHVYPGLPHGWDMAAGHLEVTKRAEHNRVVALSDF
jgi:acetyl esterase/lipase